MVFIMHVSLNNKSVILLGALVILLIGTAYPIKAAGVKVKSAEIALLGKDYVLTADIDYQLSEEVIEALNNGVSLYWTYHFKIMERRSYLWDKTVVEKAFRYRIQYHALLKMYRVRNENNGAVDNFSTLQAALDLLSTLRDYRLIEKAEIDHQKQYVAGIKVNFERDALPLPLRPMAYLNPDWYLSSDWTLWPLKK
jgi:Domain of unknown function (DUF4390)